MVPAECFQIVLVLVDSMDATCGTLYAFERGTADSDWLLHGQNPVVLGKNGLGWGRGLHLSSSVPNFPIKKEGDGRSPAGMFRLSSVFGYRSESRVCGLKMPYVHLSERVECIDDETSKHYNRIVSRDEIRESDIDWQSSEHMSTAGKSYEWGVVVDHNCTPVENGAGSCIFLHNWSEDIPPQRTEGCTAMDPEKMRALAGWLDQSKYPVLVQLTIQSYRQLIEQEDFPELIKPGMLQGPPEHEGFRVI